MTNMAGGEAIAAARTDIVSGGQTGVDRAALDFAIANGHPHAGWCPLGRRAEDGILDERYHLRETESRNYRQHTRRNVIDSDATLILTVGDLRDVVLFGAFLVWAIILYAVSRRRDRAAGTTYPSGTVGGDIGAVAVGVAIWALFAFWLHLWWIGVNPLA